MLKRIVFTARFPDWWDFKIPPLLALGYTTVYLNGYALGSIVPTLLLLLIALVVGATYVSVINDITDMQDDLAIGKKNRMVAMPASARCLIVVVLLGLGVWFGYLLRGDWRSLICYIVPWVAFTLYSVPPFRLKERGFWGVVCDASGAHLFPSLLMITGISFAMQVPVDWVWLSIVGAWAFSYGIRGILWHQYFDRNNDLTTHTKTFATTASPASANLLVTIFFIVESIACCLILIYVASLTLLLFFCGYFLLVGIRFRLNRQVPILAITPQNRPYQIFLADFYQFFLPVGVLTAHSFHYPLTLVILALHVALFPAKCIEMCRDIRNLFLKMFSRTKQAM